METADLKSYVSFILNIPVSLEKPFNFQSEIQGGWRQRNQGMKGKKYKALFTVFMNTTEGIKNQSQKDSSVGKELAAKPDNQSLILGTHVEEGDTQLWQMVL